MKTLKIKQKIRHKIKHKIRQKKSSPNNRSGKKPSFGEKQFI